MADYDPKEIFKEPIFMDTIPENIDIKNEKQTTIDAGADTKTERKIIKGTINHER